MTDERWNMEKIRELSIRLLNSRGISVSPTLPFLPDTDFQRPLEDVRGRTLCLHAAVAASYDDASPTEAMRWISSLKLDEHFSASELDFLNGKNGALQEKLRDQVECLYCFSSYLGFFLIFNAFDYCRDDLVEFLPPVGKSAKHFLTHKMRGERDPRMHADLYFCLHHYRASGREAKLPFEDYVITERRRAFIWLCYDRDWADITLSLEHGDR